MTQLRGIIFDFNGTLLWDTPYHNKAWNIFLKKYSITLSDQEILDNMHGKTNAEIFKYLFKRDFEGEELQKLASEKEGIYRQLILTDNFKLQDGVTNLFDFCLGAAIPMAIATSSDQENSEFYFDRYDLKKWFIRQRFVYNDYTFASKPAPDIFIKAASKLFLKPEEILVFEDSPAGIKSAENFGAGKIVIVNSTGDDYSQYPHPVINNFKEALDIVKAEIDDVKSRDFE
ncbi:MAG: HAD family phosphatase [Bacteroidales bacterium]|nr:HAD family phosphatase [Bacteroidales bacterium]